MKLNKEEIVLGFIYAGVWSAFIGWWTLVLAPASAFLWALGGSVNKLYRRVGCAIITGVIVGHSYSSYWIGLLSLSLSFEVLSIGYGIPTTQPEDEGSMLGRFWHRIFRNEWKSQLATRASIGMMLGLAACPLLVVSWQKWLFGTTLLVFLFPLTAQFIEGEIEL